MSGGDRDADLAELALRLLDPSAQSAIDAALDPEDGREVARWEARLGGLARAVRPETPQPGLLDAVLERVRAAAVPAGGTMTVRAGEGTWEPMGPGVSCKIVWQDRRAGRRGMLVRMAPGAVHATHSHDQDEECLVLEGELCFGDLPLAAGDFHFARKGHRHPDAVSATGCLLYISGGL